MRIARAGSRLRATAAAVALALLALAGLGNLDSAAIAAPRSALTADGITVIATPENGGLLAPGEDLVVRVRIVNDSPQPLDASTVSLWINRAATTSMTDFAEWLAPESTSADDALGTRLARLGANPILSGSAATVVFTVPAESLRLGSSAASWGAHELAARVSTGTTQRGQARSAVVWNPSKSYVPVKLATVMPLTVPSTPSGLISAVDLESYTSFNGLLTRQLDAVIGRPIAIGIDPMILVSIRILGSDAPASATSWLERLAGAGNETFALRYADYDLTAAIQAGYSRNLSPSSFDFAIRDSRFEASGEPVSPSAPETTSGTETPTPSPSPTREPGEPVLPTLDDLLAWPYTIEDVAWPAENTVSAEDLDVLVDSGFATTILSDTNVTRASMANTPNASARIGGASTVVEHSTISALLRAASTAATSADFAETIAPLSAALAIVAGEQAASPRVILATLGRGELAAASRLGDTVDAASAAPWVSLAPFSEALTTPGSSARIVDRSHSAEHIARTKQILATIAPEGKFATVVHDPTTITAPRRLQLVSVLSNVWTGNPEGWAEASTEFLADSEALLSSVQIVESSTINLLADRGSLPITIRNALDQPVTVYVTVRPLKALLAVQEPRVEVIVEPDSQRKGPVPVQSISNGEVRIEVSLTSADGVRIGELTYLDINVQAGWETIGTVVTAGLVILIFGLGLTRNIVKRRRERNTVDNTNLDAASD